MMDEEVVNKLKCTCENFQQNEDCEHIGAKVLEDVEFSYKLDLGEFTEYDFDIFLVSLYHYQLICMGDDNKKPMKKELVKVNKLIEKIVRNLPED